MLYHVALFAHITGALVYFMGVGLEVIVLRTCCARRPSSRRKCGCRPAGERSGSSGYPRRSFSSLAPI
jgi:hypothetical protein